MARNEKGESSISTTTGSINSTGIHPGSSSASGTAGTTETNLESSVTSSETSETASVPGAGVTVGTLYGVGVGPGDPELITVKAYRMIRECPVVAYPKKRKGGKSYAHEIVELYVNPDEKEMLGLIFPMTKDPVVLEREWGKTVEACWEALKDGKDVAFVTEGDPNLYSTFIHLARLMRELHPEVPISSIPGISSVLGAAAALDIHLADGDEQVGIIPATADKEAMRQAIEHHDTIVFIKVAKVLDSMLELLDEMGLGGKASVVTKVTSPYELVWRDARELKGQELEYLSLMVVSK